MVLLTLGHIGMCMGGVSVATTGGVMGHRGNKCRPSSTVYSSAINHLAELLPAGTRAERYGGVWGVPPQQAPPLSRRCRRTKPKKDPCLVVPTQAPLSHHLILAYERQCCVVIDLRHLQRHLRRLGCSSLWGTGMYPSLSASCRPHRQCSPHVHPRSGGRGRGCRRPE